MFTLEEKSDKVLKKNVFIFRLPVTLCLSPVSTHVPVFWTAGRVFVTEAPVRSLSCRISSWRASCSSRYCRYCWESSDCRWSTLSGITGQQEQHIISSRPCEVVLTQIDSFLHKGTAENIAPLSACSFLSPSWIGHPPAAAASLFSTFQSHYVALSIVLESSSRILLSQASAGTAGEPIFGFLPVDQLDRVILQLWKSVLIWRY